MGTSVERTSGRAAGCGRVLGMSGRRRAAALAALLIVGSFVWLAPTGTSSWAASLAPRHPACANGTVVPDPADHPELVADCAVLLELESTLAGTASLNWDAGLALSDWERIAVGPRTGTGPRRVIELKLRLAGPDGSLPAGLSGLTALLDLELSFNELSGAIPAELGGLTELNRLDLADNQLTGAEPQTPAPTYTFALSTDPAAADLVGLDLHATRNRVGGGKPFPGPLVATTEFEVPPSPLTLELSSSRELCTAGTLTELSWTIAGGVPPYTLTVEGKSVDAEAESHRVNCGPLTMDPLTEEPLPNQNKTFSAIVTDSQPTPVSADPETLVDLVPALPAPLNPSYSSYVADVPISWDQVPGAGSHSPIGIDPDTGNVILVTGVVRTRDQDGAAWTYHVVPHVSAAYRERDFFALSSPSVLRVFFVAAVRHPLEPETPEALNWSSEVTYTATTEAENVVITSTHDTVTVAWDKQPYARGQQIYVRIAEQYPFQNYFRTAKTWEEEGVSGRHEVTFLELEPGTDYKLRIIMVDTLAKTGPPPFDVRTKEAPPHRSPPLRGAQNLQVTATADGYVVSWDSPSPHARQVWYLRVDHVSSGRWVYSQFTHGATRWLIPTDQLASSTRYRFIIHHHDLKLAERSIEFTTPAAGASRQRSAGGLGQVVGRRTLDFFPV